MGGAGVAPVASETEAVEAKLNGVLLCGSISTMVERSRMRQRIPAKKLRWKVAVGSHIGMDGLETCVSRVQHASTGDIAG